LPPETVQAEEASNTMRDAASSGSSSAALGSGYHQHGG